MTSSLNRLAYSGFDFDSFVDELRNRIQTRYGAIYNEFSNPGLGATLIDSVAYALDTLTWYLERRVNELYLNTARTRDGVARVARQLGYRMASAVPSSVDLQVSLTQTYAFDVTIPAGFQFINTDGYIFETSEEATFLSGTTGPLEIPAYEGQTFVESYTSDGTENQEFAIRRQPNNTFVVAGRSVVRVDGAVWERQDFLEYGANDAYEVSSERNPPLLVFGDGIVGNIPTSGASITLTTVATAGRAGRVAENSITAARTSLLVAGQTIPLVVTNPEGAVGGDDPETLSQARAQAGRVFKSRRVAVTEEDYDTLAQTFASPAGGRVAVSKAFSVRDAPQDLVYVSNRDLILNTIGLHTPEAVAAAEDIEAAVTATLTGLDSLATTLADVAATLDTMLDDLAVTTGSVRTVRNIAREMQVDATDVQSEVVDLQNLVAGFTTGAVDTITSATLNAVNAILGRLSLQAGDLNSNAITIQTQSETTIADLQDTQDTGETVGRDLTTAGTLLTTAETLRAAAVTSLGDSTAATGVYAATATIIAGESAIEDTVSTALDAITRHIDGLVADECKVNLISVPILSRDAAGFYAAPTYQLINDLQVYLDERKEVTQNVEVVSGAFFLVPAVIRVRMSIEAGYSDRVLQTSAEAALDGVLRARAFGRSLTLDELYAVLRPLEGVSFLNVVIEGEDTGGPSPDVSRLDSEGNLIIAKGEVVTKGSYSYNLEFAT